MGSEIEILTDELKVSVMHLQPFLYFSIFAHPITVEEYHFFLPFKTSKETSLRFLNKLMKDEIILKNQNYYHLSTEIIDVEIRRKDELNFDLFKNRIIKNTKLISKFPFVKAIFISGSASKGVVKDDGDIDFFIVTKHNRLWICRTLLILYKKIFRLNSKKFFCLNYFIGENDLEISDKNIFTATEIASLIPIYNSNITSKFFELNQWYKTYFPNSTINNSIETIRYNNNIFRRFFESCLNFNFLDTFFLNFTIKTWKKKFPQFTHEEMELTLRSKRNISKHHPSNFQTKVLKLFSERFSKYENM